MNSRKNFPLICLLIATILSANLSASMEVVNSTAIKSGIASPTVIEDELRYPQSCCILNTCGKYPSIKYVDPRNEECRIYLCGTRFPKETKAHLKKSVTDLEYLAVLREMNFLHGIAKRQDIKYLGWRETFVGKLIDKTIPQRVYTKSILFEMYKKECPQLWLVQNNSELKALAINLINAIEINGYSSTKKPILFLSINNDPMLKTLDQTDKEFISKYFTQVEPSNEKVKDFFEKSRNAIYEICRDCGGCKKFLGESFSEAFLRELEDHYDEFKVKENLVKLTFLIIAFDIYNHGKIWGALSSIYRHFFSAPPGGGIA